MIVSPEEKEKLNVLVDTNRNYAETIAELLQFYNTLVQELKYSNPPLSLRIMRRQGSGDSGSIETGYR